MRVMLKPTWPGTFRRNLRDEEGGIVETLTFEDRSPLDLTDEQLSAVKDDIGKSLCIAQDAADKPDWDATNEFCGITSEGDESGLKKFIKRLRGGKKKSELDKEPVPAGAE